MSLASYKITNAEVRDVQVEGRDRVLRGTVAQNQAVFDDFSDLIVEKFNSFVDGVDATEIVEIDDEAKEAYSDIGWIWEEA